MVDVYSLLEVSISLGAVGSVAVCNHQKFTKIFAFTARLIPVNSLHVDDEQVRSSDWSRQNTKQTIGLIEFLKLILQF